MTMFTNAEKRVESTMRIIYTKITIYIIFTFIEGNWTASPCVVMPYCMLKMSNASTRGQREAPCQAVIV